MTDLQVIRLLPKKDAPIKAGHPWIFSNAIADQKVNSSIPKGSLVKILSDSQEFLGIGMFNPDTSIRVRLLSHSPIQDCGVDFFRTKIDTLNRDRLSFLPADTNAYRVVHGDADLLPGLIVDKFNDTIVFQIHTAGMDKFRNEIVLSLNTIFSPSAIVERSDIEARKREGIPVLPPVIHSGKVTGPVIFTESGLTLHADVLAGQKTGFFLDQRESRKMVRSLAKDKTMLDLFGYTGGFGLAAASGGAKKVITVDTSKHCFTMASLNFSANNLSLSDNSDAPFSYVVADVFDFLNSSSASFPSFDLIVCDPPAFAKTGKNLPQALKTYTSLNKKCLELLHPGGILVTCSCSGTVSQEDFKNALKLAAGRARRDVRIIDILGQPFDHTQKLSFPEGKYLKTFFLEVIEEL